MITRRGFVFLAFAIVCYLAVLVINVPAFLELSMLAAALLLACGLYTWTTCYGIGAQVQAPRQAVVGEQITVRLRVYNRLPMPRFGILWRLSFSAGGPEGTFVWTWLDSLRLFGERELALPVHCHARGQHTVGPVSLIYSDPLGLFSRERTFKLSSPVEILPASAELDAFPFIESGAGFRDPEKTMPTPGFSNDFYAIRPYLHGDSPRWIHWLSTVRMQQLMTRQFQAPVQRRILLVLDCSRASVPFTGDAEAFELAVSAAASVVRFAAETEHEVGLLTLGKSPAFIPPAAGLDNVRYMVSRLATVRQDGRRGHYDLSQVLVTGVQSLVVITATGSDAFVQAMVALRGEGLSLSTVIAHPQADRGAAPKRHAVRELAGAGLPVCHLRGAQRLKHDLEHPASLPATMLPDWDANRSLRKVI